MSNWLIIFTVLLFSLGLAFSLPAQESAVEERLWEESSQQNPGLSMQDIKAFYQEHVPDLLKEFADNARQLPDQAAGFLQQLVNGYRDLQKIRKENPTLYQWQLRRLGDEVKIRRTAKEIKQLEEFLHHKSAANEPTRVLELHQKKQELKKMLEEAFLASQQQQQIEINRLEAEINMLKQLLEERNASRELILQEQYRKLTNTEW
ncbi:MAG: hypothetical protein GX927_04350 [Lentisphaerae bacterium]|nr:hypothetical protein [Lentisphaerota bacterium]